LAAVATPGTSGSNQSVVKRPRISRTRFSSSSSSNSTATNELYDDSSLEKNFSDSEDEISVMRQLCPIPSSYNTQKESSSKKPNRNSFDITRTHKENVRKKNEEEQ